jgi:hypothetical protein
VLKERIQSEYFGKITARVLYLARPYFEGALNVECPEIHRLSRSSQRAAAALTNTDMSPH